MIDKYDLKKLQRSVADSHVLDLGSAVPELHFDEGANAARFKQEFELKRSEVRPSLFDYQRELVDAMAEVTEQRSWALLALPTGAGKTRTAAASILEMFADERCRSVLWIAPSIELLNQACETVVKLWNADGDCPDIVLLRDSLHKSDVRPHIVFATPQEAHARLKAGKSLRSDWDLIVFDEAHQVPAPTYIGVLKILSGGDTPAAVIGLSATPGRPDEGETEDLVAMFNGALLISSALGLEPVKTLQNTGVLAKLNFNTIGDDYRPALSESARLVEAIRLCRERVQEGARIMVFAGSVAGSIVLGESLRKVGVRAHTILAEMSDGQRAEIIETFANGRIDVLVNHRLLATGFDCPAVTDVVILSKIGSPVLFEQIVGRAARGPLVGGSKTANIWQFNDHLKLHGLPQSYYRYRSFDWF